MSRKLSNTSIDSKLRECLKKRGLLAPDPRGPKELQVKNKRLSRLLGGMKQEGAE